MMKKGVAVLMVVLISASLFVGCTGGQQGNPEEGQQQQQEELEVDQQPMEEEQQEPMEEGQ
ncbi:hypothetical protein [Halanaerobaculum tunisiense]